MRRGALLLLLLAGCRQRPDGEAPRAPETAAGVEMIDYAPPAGTFSCPAPAAWKGEETSDYGPDEVAFIAPAGARGASVSISISRFPNKADKYVDPEAYAKSWSEVDGKPVAMTKTDLGGRSVIRYFRERPARALHSRKVLYQVRDDAALIPAPGGFFEIRHSAPLEDYRRTLPVFEAVVRGFRPKS